MVCGVPVKQQVQVGDYSFVCKTDMYTFLEITSASFQEMCDKLGSMEAAFNYYLQKKERTPPEPIAVVNGVTCYSNADVYYALKLTIRRTAFSDYVRANGLEAAIKHYQECGPGGRYASIERYTVGDKSNLGIKEAAELAHTAAPTLRKRSEETGKSIQTLLDESYAEYMKDPPPYFVGDIECSNPTEVARVLGVSAPVVLSRVRGGMKVADVIAQIQSDLADKATNEAERGKASTLGLSLKLYTSMCKELGGEDKVADYVAKYPKFFSETCAHGRGAWRELPFWDCTIDGKRMYILSDIAATLNTTVSAIHCWKSAHPNCTVNDIIAAYKGAPEREYPKERISWKPVVIDDVTYDTCEACAKHFGMSVATLRQAIRKKGFDVAIKELKEKGFTAHISKFTRNNKDIQIAQSTDTSHAFMMCAVCHKLYILPMSVLQAFSHKLCGTMPDIPAGWQLPMAFRQRAIRIDRSLARRYTLPEKPRDLVEEAEEPETKQDKRVVMYHGIPYPSKQALLRHLGLGSHVIYSESAAGSSIEEIIDNYKAADIVQSRWTDAEVQILKDKYATCGPDIPELLGRHTRRHIISKASTMGFSQRNRSDVPWPVSDDNILREHYSTEGCDYCRKHLSVERSKQDVYNRAYTLGLKSEKATTPWTEEELAVLQRDYPIYGYDIPKLKHRTVASIQNKARKLGIMSRIGDYRISSTGTENFIYICCGTCGNIYIVKKEDHARFTHNLCGTGLLIKVPQGWHTTKYMEQVQAGIRGT